MPPFNILLMGRDILSMVVIIYVSPDLGALMCFLDLVMVFVGIMPQDVPGLLI